jgi:pectin lyase
MKYTAILAALAAQAAAVSVSGSAEGFAKGVTGGGSATAVYPDTIDELVSYLGNDEARVIVLSKTFDFTGSEGTTTATGCHQPERLVHQLRARCAVCFCFLVSCKSGGLLETVADSCFSDNAGTLGITVASDKTIIGEGSTGVIKGKGLRIVSGASNIIIQYVCHQSRTNETLY